MHAVSCFNIPLISNLYFPRPSHVSPNPIGHQSPNPALRSTLLFQLYSVWLSSAPHWFLCIEACISHEDALWCHGGWKKTATNSVILRDRPHVGLNATRRFLWKIRVHSFILEPTQTVAVAWVIRSVCSHGHTAKQWLLLKRWSPGL
jgi:hypothetical protein